MLRRWLLWDCPLIRDSGIQFHALRIQCPPRVSLRSSSRDKQRGRIRWHAVEPDRGVAIFSSATFHCLELSHMESSLPPSHPGGGDTRCWQHFLLIIWAEEGELFSSLLPSIAPTLLFLCRAERIGQPQKQWRPTDDQLVAWLSIRLVFNIREEAWKSHSHWSTTVNLSLVSLWLISYF